MNNCALLFCLFLSVLLSSAPCSFSAEEPDFIRARRKMVEHDLKGRDINDPVVLEAMGRVPRHLFVEPSLRSKAYGDYPLPIGGGQTISQPYIVALMTQVLQIKPGDRILEVGTGSGYQAAVLAEITDQVYTIEIVDTLAKEAARRLKELGYDKIQVRSGDGYQGWEQAAPFDGILVTAAAGHIPPALVAQLKEGGRLVMPVGNTRGFQTLTLITKKDGKPEVQRLIGVAFVPMTGEAQKK